MSVVSEIPAAPSHQALAHFQAEFGFETDCWDVHVAITRGEKDFVLLDVRSHEAFESGHIATAISLPHAKIIASRMAQWPQDTLFVVYCGGPHCNGASRAAVRLARLNRPVKLMAGGITGWLDESLELQREKANLGAAPAAQ